MDRVYKIYPVVDGIMQIYPVVEVPYIIVGSPRITVSGREKMNSLVWSYIRLHKGLATFINMSGFSSFFFSFPKTAQQVLWHTALSE